MRPQPASKSACCHLNAWLMSWLIVFLRTFSLNKREQCEASYHKVAADETTLVLIHAGCALADEVWCPLKFLRQRRDRCRLSLARPARWTFRQRTAATRCSPAPRESARVPVGIKGTERWGEGEGERGEVGEGRDSGRWSWCCQLVHTMIKALLLNVPIKVAVYFFGFIIFILIKFNLMSLILEAFNSRKLRDFSLITSLFLHRDWHFAWGSK